MKALIIHARRTGLGILRSLASEGIDCYVADTFKSEGFYSKYVKKGFIIPNLIELGSESLLQSLDHISAEIDPDNEGIFLFSGSDDYLLFFVDNWSVLSISYKATFETNKKVLSSCLAKTKMYEIAKKANVSIPSTFYSPVNTSQITDYPVIIKPSLKKTDTVDVVKDGFRIRKSRNKEELEDAINILKTLDVDYVVQQYIPGGDETLFTAGIFAYKGALIAIATGRKLRQFPPELGECSLGELVNEPVLESVTAKLLNQAKLTGICQVEYKKYKEQFYLMEINPRPWSWISLTDYAGVNLPFIAINTIESDSKKQGEVIKQREYSGYWMFPTVDFLFNVFKSKNQSFLGFIKDIKKTKKFAFWDRKDLKPFFAHIYCTLIHDFLKKRLFKS